MISYSFQACYPSTAALPDLHIASHSSNKPRPPSLTFFDFGLFLPACCCAITSLCLTC